MSKLDDAERVEPTDRRAWASWLEEHHDASGGVWVRLDQRKAPGTEAHSYENAVCEALCWGWIDGQTRTEPGASLIWFSPRRPRSGWAATNKARVERLLAEGRMRPAGIAMIERARADGSWTMLDGPEAGIEPPALAAALDDQPDARAFWDALPPSARKYALTQIATAKRDETRASRVHTIVRRCAAGERPDR